MRMRFCTLASLFLSLSFAAVGSAQEWADLKMTFVYDGAVPKPAKIDNAGKGAFCGALNILEENLVVDAETKGVKNVAIYLDVRGGAPDIHPDLKAVPTEKPILDNDKCIFVPHVSIIRAGQTILVRNKDDEGHNANFNFFNNQPQNVTIPIGGEKDVQTVKDEPAPIPVDCNIHPWMRSYVIIKDHPYVGLSDEKGELVIEKLPAGKDLTFRIWHESADGAIDEVEMGGKTEKWRRGRFELNLKAGENDMGVVKISPKKFGK